MSYITISTEETETFSLISNHFIDYYMTEANGEFVKVYLYLVRLLSSKSPISVADIADHFNLTEKDICRAIRYWISRDVLKLNYDTAGNLTGITLLPLHEKEETDDESLSQDSISLLKFPEGKSSKATASKSKSRAENKSSHTQDAGVKPALPEKQPYSYVLAEKLKKDDAFSDVIFEIETYFGKTLSTNDLEILIYIHEDLNFPLNVIEYLIEYCVSVNKKSLRYAEGVAKNWYLSGVKTLEDAKAASENGNPLYRAVLKALGIKNRNLTSAETPIIDSWSKDMGFEVNVIVEACNRGVLQKPNIDNIIPYVNGILTKWHDAGIKTIADIEKSDNEYHSNKAKSSSQKSNQYVVKPNAFNSFKQKDMSAELDEMEQLFLDEINSD